MQTPDHILLVDDDRGLRDLLARYLVDVGLRVSTAADATEARTALATTRIDLVVLDLMLPGEDGLSLCRWLRGRGEPHVPVLMLTARAEETDRVVGLEMGADDYLTKPFASRELLARIRAVLRRYQRPPEQTVRDDKRRAFRFAGWELNLRTRRLGAPDGRKLELSNNEFSLLVAFCSAPQRVLSRDQLLDLSRLHSAEVYDRTIDVQILRLRRKIERDHSKPELIVTERGAGYLFTPSVETLY